MTISKIQAAAAADLIRTIRPGWDALATQNVISDMSEHVPFPKVVAAAIQAASNPDNKSPLSIKWQEIPADNTGGSAGKYADEPRCDICKLRRTRCRYMAAKTGDPHEFTVEDIPVSDPAVTPGDWVEMIKDLVKRPG